MIIQILILGFKGLIIQCFVFKMLPIIVCFHPEIFQTSLMKTKQQLKVDYKKKLLL